MAAGSEPTATGKGSPTGPSPTVDDSEARTAELDRISSKLERLSPQRRALRKAISQFGEDFDAKIWADAFDSPDPDDINRVFAVTGGYLALINNTVEAVKIGARLVGVAPTPTMQGTSGLIDAIRRSGGFTDGQAETFTELYRTRNRLQHASPDIEADEVHRQIRLLLRHLPRFLKSYLGWLKEHGVQL